MNLQVADREGLESALQKEKTMAWDRKHKKNTKDHQPLGETI